VLIKGFVDKANRYKAMCPDDGVHRRTKKGLIKHPNVLLLNGELLYCGTEAFYWNNVKVYYSFRFLTALAFAQIERIKNQMKEYGSLCVSTKEIISVNLDIDYEHKSRIKRKVWGLEVEHVSCPQPAWEMFCKGQPYDWKAVGHPDHSRSGFERFVKKAIKTLRDCNRKSVELGNAGWCTKKNRWIVMDVDREEQ